MFDLNISYNLSSGKPESVTMRFESENERTKWLTVFNMIKERL